MTKPVLSPYRPPVAQPRICPFTGLISRSPCILPAGHRTRHLLAKDAGR